MELKYAHLLFICLLMGFSGCRPNGDNLDTNLKTETEERELKQIDTLISHYYATNLDSAEYYCYRKIYLLQSLGQLEPVVETCQFLTVLYRFHKLDSLQTMVLNNKLSIVRANTEQTIITLRYRQLMATKIAHQQRIAIFMKLLIVLIVALALLFIIQLQKRINNINKKIVSRTMEIVANEDGIYDCPLSSSQKDGNGDLGYFITHSKNLQE